MRTRSGHHQDCHHGQFANGQLSHAAARAKVSRSDRCLLVSTNVDDAVKPEGSNSVLKKISFSGAIVNFSGLELANEEKNCSTTNSVTLNSLKEISIPTAFVHQLFFEKLNKIVNSNDNFYLIIDLTKVKDKIPNVEVRAKIRDNFEYYRNQIIHGCVIVGSNLFMKFATRLTLRGQIKSISTHSNINEAKEKITSMKKQS